MYVSVYWDSHDHLQKALNLAISTFSDITIRYTVVCSSTLVGQELSPMALLIASHKGKKNPSTTTCLVESALDRLNKIDLNL